MALTWDAMKHFEPVEFDSPDLPGSGAGMNLEFVQLLEELRVRVGFPLKILSGFRTPEHNREVGGVDSSAHEKGLAADIACRDSAQRMAVLREALQMGIHRMGIGNGFIHLDVDPSKPPGVCWLYPHIVTRGRSV
jgi:zinc D-Ala-D-Ala carboxypeptidase